MKKLIKANSLYLGISLLSSSSAILLIPLYLHYFSVAEYGELALMNASFSFLAIIITLSLESAFQTFYFDYKSEEIPTYFRQVRSFALLFALVITAIMCIVGPGLFRLVFSNDQLRFYPNGILMTLNVAVTLINQIYFVLLRNQEKVKTYGLYMAISTILSIGSQVLLITVFDQGVTGALSGMLLANATVFVLTLKRAGGFSLNVKLEPIRKSIRYSLWLLPFFAINWFLAKGDRMVVERLLGLSEVGIYALLMNISMIISLLATSVLNSVRPTLFASFKKLSGKIDAGTRNILLYFIAILIGSSTMIYLFVMSLERFSLFEDYLKVKDYILLALILFSIRAMFRLFSEYLSFLKRSKDLSVISVISAVLFAGLLLFRPATLDMNQLLSIMIGVNTLALSLVIGRCIYLLKTRHNGA